MARQALFMLLAYLAMADPAAASCPAGLTPCNGVAATCGDHACCEGVSSSCGAHSLCSGVSSTCGPDSRCTGQGSHCGARSVCSGIGSSCGPGSQCAGPDSHCGPGSSCSGIGAVCEPADAGMKAPATASLAASGGQLAVHKDDCGMGPECAGRSNVAHVRGFTFCCKAGCENCAIVVLQGPAAITAKCNCTAGAAALVAGLGGGLSRSPQSAGLNKAAVAVVAAAAGASAVAAMAAAACQWRSRRVALQGPALG